MELLFKQVEAVFADRFGVGPERAVAFRGRLQHLQRLGFPDGVRTGSGKKAGYGWKQVIQLMVALDLIDLGFTPDTAIRRVKGNTDQLVAALYRVVSNFETQAKLAKAIQNERCPNSKTEIALTSAAALSFSQGAADDPGYLYAVSGSEFQRSFTDQRDEAAIAPAAAYIDLGARLMLIANRVGRMTAPNASETATDLRQWLEHQVHEDTLS